MSDLRPVRIFSSGATRDQSSDKPDYEGFLSPWAIVEFGRYMHRHRLQADGRLRDSDNWQKGIPTTEYMKSMFRHFVTLWSLHRSANRCGVLAGKIEALCALLFNVQGYLHELLKEPTTCESTSQVPCETCPNQTSPPSTQQRERYD